VQQGRGLRLILDVGSTAPLYAGCSSKVLLAYQDEKAIDRVLGGDLRPVTTHTITDPAQIRAHAGDRPSFDPAHIAGGKITAVSATSITLAGRDGKTQTVKIDAKTKIYAGRDEAKVSALKTGWLAFVQKNDAGVAVSIRAADPAAIKRHFNHHRFVMPANAAAGKITAVTGSSITLQSRDGKTATVKVNGSTRVFTHGGAAELSSLKTGWVAFVIRGKDGVATVIHAADPAQFGHRGDFGHHGDDDGGDAPTSTNTSF